jgi:hypothetical protein
MAAGQGVGPSTRRSIHGAGRSRSHDDPIPEGLSRQPFAGLASPVGQKPSLRHQPRNDFLILIVGDSHLDCRAANPIDAARAVIAVEFLADELRVNPRWIGMSGTSRFGMLQARTDTRRVLGIAPDAPSPLVVDALLRLTVALRAGDQSASMQALGAPVFTLPPSQTLRILSNLPYIQSANQVTLQAANEAVAFGR